MKKINSIDYGGKVIGIGLVIGLLIPGILLLVNRYLQNRGITMLIIAMAAVGTLIIVVFLCIYA